VSPPICIPLEETPREHGKVIIMGLSERERLILLAWGYLWRCQQLYERIIDEMEGS
jgi:hypothetical protein